MTVARDLRGVAGTRWISLRATVGDARTDHGLAAVPVRARLRFQGRGAIVVTDQIWLKRTTSGWRLVKPGAAYRSERPLPSTGSARRVGAAPAKPPRLG